MTAKKSVAAPAKEPTAVSVPEPHLRKVDEKCPHCPHLWGGHLVSKKKIVCPTCGCSTYLPKAMREPKAA